MRFWFIRWMMAGDPMNPRVTRTRSRSSSWLDDADHLPGTVTRQLCLLKNFVVGDGHDRDSLGSSFGHIPKAAKPQPNKGSRKGAKPTIPLFATLREIQKRAHGVHVSRLKNLSSRGCGRTL